MWLKSESLECAGTYVQAKTIFMYSRYHSMLVQLADTKHNVSFNEYSDCNHNCCAITIKPFIFPTFIRAASSEFMSSSIPSRQILTVHAQPFRGARDLAFWLKVPLDSLPVWVSSGGSGETARMRRLTWTFAARIGDKYQIRLTRPIWYIHSSMFLEQPYNSKTKFFLSHLYRIIYDSNPAITVPSSLFATPATATCVVSMTTIQQLLWIPLNVCCTCGGDTDLSVTSTVAISPLDPENNWAGT